MAKLKPFIIGNSKNIKVTVTDKVTKTPIDVTGDKFYFTVKENVGQEDVDAVVQESVTVPAGADATNGIAIIPVPASATSSVEPDTYLADVVWLKLSSAPGERETVFQSEVNFVQAVTRAQS